MTLNSMHKWYWTGYVMCSMYILHHKGSIFLTTYHLVSSGLFQWYNLCTPKDAFALGINHFHKGWLSDIYRWTLSISTRQTVWSHFPSRPQFQLDHQTATQEGFPCTFNTQHQKQRNAATEHPVLSVVVGATPTKSLSASHSSHERNRENDPTNGIVMLLWAWL